MKPLLVHLLSYSFTPRSHPGIWRMITGLAPHFRSLVLQSGRAPYHGAPLSDEESEVLARADIAVRTLDFNRLKKPGQIGWLAAGIRGGFGQPSGLLANLGNNGWRSLPLARSLDVPVTTVFHGNDANVDLRDDTYIWRYQRLAAAPGARYLGVSGNIIERLIEFGMNPDRCAVQHLGVDLSGYAVPERSAKDAGPFTVVLAGRLMDFKGHRTALEAFPSFLAGHPGSTLHFFGDGDLEAELRALAAARGLADAVHFRGVVPVEELAAALSSADIALQPSVTASDGRSEGVPNTVLEALAVGLPVIGSRHAGIPEAILDGETGLLIDEHDAKGLAIALERLALDPVLRRRLGMAGRRHIEAEFDSVRQGERLAADLSETAAAYRAFPGSARRRAWGAALDGLIEPPDEYGLRYRAAWAWKTLRNRFSGDVA